MLFSSGTRASVRLSSTRSGTFGEKGSGSGLAREGAGVVLSWSASTEAVEVESTWIGGIESR